MDFMCSSSCEPCRFTLIRTNFHVNLSNWTLFYLNKQKYIHLQQIRLKTSIEFEKFKPCFPTVSIKPFVRPLWFITDVNVKFIYYFDRLLWLLEEYASSVQTDKPVSIETENINLQVINVTEPNKELHYKPALEDDSKVKISNDLDVIQ